MEYTRQGPKRKSWHIQKIGYSSDYYKGCISGNYNRYVVTLAKPLHLKRWGREQLLDLWRRELYRLSLWWEDTANLRWLSRDHESNKLPVYYLLSPSFLSHLLPGLPMDHREARGPFVRFMRVASTSRK